MNGKGDSPRNCFSDSFKENYEQVSWRGVRITCRVCGKEKEQKSFVRMNLNKKTGICKKCSKNKK